VTVFVFNLSCVVPPEYLLTLKKKGDALSNTCEFLTADRHKNIYSINHSASEDCGTRGKEKKKHEMFSPLSVERVFFIFIFVFLFVLLVRFCCCS